MDQKSLADKVLMTAEPLESEAIPQKRSYPTLCLRSDPIPDSYRKKTLGVERDRVNHRAKSWRKSNPSKITGARRERQD
jgi:hypothetical protein